MKKIIYSVLIALVLLVIFFFWTNAGNDDTRKKAYENAKDIAMTTADMQTFDEFYLYRGNESWDVITGKTSDGKKIGVWIENKENVKPITIALNTGISEKEAIAILEKDRSVDKIVSSKLGMEKGFPLWEITFINTKGKYGYYYIDFESGDKLKSFDNL